MVKFIRKIFIIGLIIFLLMQFYQPARNEYGQVLPIHFSQVYKVPPKIERILQSSCYDCHSNKTQYPLYSYLQPVRFFMDRHIENGKQNLNFSEWGNYSKRKQENKLAQIVSQVKAGEMPLPSYKLMHENAVLTTPKKVELFNWIEKVTDSIAEKNENLW